MKEIIREEKIPIIDGLFNVKKRFSNVYPFYENDIFNEYRKKIEQDNTVCIYFCSLYYLFGDSVFHEHYKKKIQNSVANNYIEYIHDEFCPSWVNPLGVLKFNTCKKMCKQSNEFLNQGLRSLPSIELFMIKNDLSFIFI